MQMLASIFSVFSLLFHSSDSTNLAKLTPTPPTHIVCIDPGHGGDDTGAVYKDLREAEVNLDIAQRLQKLLQKDNIGVVLTRTDNTLTLSNSDRANICNQGHANLLVAIHLNYSDDPTLDYTQGLYGTSSDSKDQVFTEVMHQALVDSLGVPDHDITDFGDNVMQKATMPATLQETVFLSNDNEYAQLTDGTGNRQEQIAVALDNGIKDWFTKNR